MGKDKEQTTGQTVSEVTDREKWGHQVEFVLSCIGYAVGLGNVWRFPYLCYRNGGGAFLIPYILMLAFAGLPLFYMELCMGQFSQLGALTVWKMSPAFKGLGFASVLMTWLVAIYYNVIIMYTVFFFFASFASEVPWASCGNWWNTPNCYIRNTTEDCGNGMLCNMTRNLTGKEQSPAAEYWERYVVELSDGIDNLGGIKWQLALCLLLCWIVVYVCIIRGVRSSGKVVYFTATFPYVVLLTLLIRGATLPGAIDGIKFYIIPDFKKLGEAQVWVDAAVQIFYSLGPCWGGLITLASYNRFKNNCYRDAVIVSVCNCGTSVFAGFVIFSMLGFMANELGQEIKDVARDGPGLAFIAYPEGIAKMPVAPVWAVLFFFMLFTLGLDSQFTMMETLVTAVVDEYPRLRRRKSIVTLIVCIITFLLGLPLVTKGGQYLFQVMDWYAGGISLIVVGFVEPLVISYVYGVRRFCRDIEMMLGYTPNYYWLVCWTFLTPAVLLFILVFSSVGYVAVSYGSYVYPKWAEIFGWCLSAASMQFILTVMIITFIMEVRNCSGFAKFINGVTAKAVLRKMFKPASDWGPCAGNGGLQATPQPVTGETEKPKMTDLPNGFENAAFTP